MAESIKELREIYQPSEESGVALRYRKVSIYFTKMFLYTSVTANQITVLFAICGVISGILFAVGNYWWSLLGTTTLLIHYILDYVDGEVARYRKSTSQRGAFIDIVCHDIAFAFVFSGIGYNVYLRYSNHLILFMGSATASLVIISFSIYGFKYLLRPSKKGANHDNEKDARELKHILQNISILWTPFGVTHIIILASITDLLNMVLILYTIVTPFWLAIQLYKLT